MTYPILAGLVATVLTAMLALVRIAIRAERGRADDWREAAKTTTAANSVLSTNVEKLIGSVEHLATSQREMLVLLQAMAGKDRSAA